LHDLVAPRSLGSTFDLISRSHIERYGPLFKAAQDNFQINLPTQGAACDGENPSFGMFSLQDKKLYLNSTSGMK
jgi:hypothetical protein